MIVHFVRKHLAKPGVTVTESKLLHDVVLDVEREVDVVVEGDFDGDPVVTSVEVIEHNRPAPITWVEQQIKKHRRLPTNHLVLVSKSGFSRTALKEVAAEGGWVEAVRPEVVEVDGQPVVKRLYFDSVNLTPDSCRLRVRSPDGEAAVVAAQPNYYIYNSDGNLIGPIARLAVEAVSLDWVGTKFSVEAHSHPERDQLTRFMLDLVVGELGYCLRANETGELHTIEVLHIEGQFAHSQDEIPFTVTDLAGRRYGAGEATLIGRPTVWVATTDNGTQTTTVSWRTADDKPLLEPKPAQPRLFPALLTLVPPPDFVVPAASPVAGPDPEMTDGPGVTPRG